MYCNPAGISPHHFQIHHAVVAFGSRVQFVERFGGGIHRGIKSKSVFRAGDIIVYRFGNSDHGNSFFHENAGELQASIAAHNDQSIQAESAVIFQQLAWAVLHFNLSSFITRFERKRITTIAGSENCAAALHNTFDIFEAQRAHLHGW